MSDEVRYRWVEGATATDAEWECIRSVSEARGWMLLNKRTSRVLIAEDTDDQILGFICLQLIPHTEPLYVAPNMRGTGIAEELADRMLEFMQDMKARGFMVVAENAYVVKLCEARGMRRVEAPVFVMVGDA